MRPKTLSSIIDNMTHNIRARESNLKGYRQMLADARANHHVEKAETLLTMIQIFDVNLFDMKQVLEDLESIENR